MDYENKLSYENIFRVVCDIIASELTKSRGNIDDLPVVTDWKSETFIKQKELEADSLELLTIAGKLNKKFHLFETGIEDHILKSFRIGDLVEIIFKSLAKYHKTITFSTSGSTGAEKDILHHWDELIQEVLFFSNLFQSSKRILSFVPCHHIYGFLFTVLLPKALNIPVIDIRFKSIGTIKNLLSSNDFIVSVPVNWEYLNQSISFEPELMPKNIKGVTSTAPCSPDLIESLKRKGFNQITEIFGSSETSGIGYRQSPLSPYQLLPFLKRISNNSNEYVLEKSLPSGLTRIIEIVDTIKWDNHQRFWPIKRKDGCVQIGGINVHPEVVAQKISSHPNIEKCHVRLMNPNEGNRLKAFIVPKKFPISPEKKNDLKQWIRKQLTTPERPTFIAFGPSIPVNEIGKYKDFSIQH